MNPSNKDLNVFKVMTQDEKLKEVKKTGKAFPLVRHGHLSRKDIENLYLGRIIQVLDEFSETDRWIEFGSMSVDKMIIEYEKLVLRYVKENKPEILSCYKEYYDLE